MTTVYHTHVQLSLFTVQEQSPQIKTVTLICSYCGKEFQRDKGIHKYRVKHSQTQQFFCSRECAGIGTAPQGYATKKNENTSPNQHRKQYPLITLTCNQCGKEFQREKHRYNTRVNKLGIQPVYCSNSCINTATKTLPIPPSIGEDYLQGQTLLDIAQRYHTSEGIIWHRLKKMGIPIRKDGTRWKNGHPLQGKSHTKEARQKISEAAIQQFSSPEQREMLSQRAITMLTTGKFPASSKLEDYVAQELSKQGIAFIRQYGIKQPGQAQYIACVDFMLNDGRVIEVNGTYWHADPRKYPNGPIYDAQKKKVANDQKKQCILAELNIPLIVLWEMDLTADMAGTISKALSQ